MLEVLQGIFGHFSLCFFSKKSTLIIRTVCTPVNFVNNSILSAENKGQIIEILAKNCSDKSKLKKLQDKYKKKHDKVRQRFLYLDKVGCYSSQ